MRISDWSSDVCSSVLADLDAFVDREHRRSVDLPGRLVEDRIIREDHIRRGEQEARAPVVRGAERHRRSEERRVGKEGGSTGGSRWLTESSKKKQHENNA